MSPVTVITIHVQVQTSGRVEFSNLDGILLASLHIRTTGEEDSFTPATEPQCKMQTGQTHKKEIYILNYISLIINVNCIVYISLCFFRIISGSTNDNCRLPRTSGDVYTKKSIIGYNYGPAFQTIESYKHSSEILILDFSINK